LLLGNLDQQIGYFYLVFLIDLSLGIWVAIKTKTFSKKFLVQKTLEKLIIYTLLIIAGHAGDRIMALKNQIRGGVLFVLFGRELLSLLRKIKELGYKNVVDSIEHVLPKELIHESQEEGSENVRDATPGQN
jgi:phage-related holin